MSYLNEYGIENDGDKKARLMLRGQWFYDNVVPMPVQIFAVNYDYYFEIDREEGFSEKGAKPELNEDGEYFLIAWHDDKFFSFAGSTGAGGLTIEEAKASAERVVKQKIKWLKIKDDSLLT